MKKSFHKLASGIILSGSMLLFDGCSSMDSMLESMIVNRPESRTALEIFSSSYERNMDNDVSIDTVEGFNPKSLGQGDNIFLLVHGLASNGDSWGEEENPESFISRAKEEFGNNVCIVNYPTDGNISELGDSLIEKLDEFYAGFGKERPEIVALGHSLGGQVTRYIVRRRPEYFKDVILVASPNAGIDIRFENFFRGFYPEYLNERLSGNDEVDSSRPYGTIDDLFPDSSFMESLNSPTRELDITYHFILLNKDKRNIIVPGKDDGLISNRTAYPEDNIREGNFEDVRIGEIIVFEGNIDHYSFTKSPLISENIFSVLEYEEGDYSRGPRRFRERKTITLPPDKNYTKDIASDES